MSCVRVSYVPVPQMRQMQAQLDKDINVVGQLQRIGDMKARGLLSDAEFAAAKKKILGL